MMKNITSKQIFTHYFCNSIPAYRNASKRYGCRICDFWENATVVVVKAAVARCGPSRAVAPGERAPAGAIAEADSA